MSSKISKDQFIDKIQSIHGNKYDYSLIEYVNQNVKIKIICKEHGIFEQLAGNHLNGHGCSKCRNIKLSFLNRKNIENFILLANVRHNNFYNYSLSEYKCNKQKIKIICPIHGVFEQTPNNHLKGNRCPECGKISRADLQRKSQNIFLNELKVIHENSYDYSLVNYKNDGTKIVIMCNKCLLPFEQRPRDHLKGNGCPLCCGGSISKSEIRWLDKLLIPKTKKNRQAPIRINNRLYKVDGFIPETNTIYEFLGDYWHGNPIKYDPNSINPTSKQTYGFLYEKTCEKLELFRQKGFNVITIWESEFKEYGITI